MDQEIENDFLNALCRLLLRIKNLGHGGAVLVTPNGIKHPNLKIKYSTSYDRLRTSIERKKIFDIRWLFASDQIMDIVENDGKIPSFTYLEEVVNSYERDESGSEVDGTLWFISLLSRVDGLILMTPTFVVTGFGVEITASQQPQIVFKASNATASPSRLKPHDYELYGTRHRSMMRYCASNENSVGFVISQDGDVKAITQVSGKVVIWENIKLQVLSYALERRLNQKAILETFEE